MARGPQASTVRPRRGFARHALTIALFAMLLFSAYGTLAPSPVRCGLPGAVGCPGGLLGPEVLASSAGEQFFTVTMYDWGFWIVDSTTGANETTSWNVFEGWTVHINATSLAPNSAIGGTAYHGLGIELNATGQQLLSLAAPVGQWTPGSFVAPNAVYHHQHIWCTISCGPGHSNQQAWVLNVIPPVPLPKATASANVSAGAAPLDVSLTGAASAGTPPYNTTWDFGDGSPIAYGLTANHTYTLGGNYSAKFQVTDSKGMVAVASASVLVRSSARLSVALTASLASGVAPLPASFSAVTHGGAPPYSFAWSFGDGGGAAGANFTDHLFAAPGVYAVLVTVRDSAGSTASALASVTAVPALGSFPVQLTAKPANGSAPIILQFNATPLGGAAPYTYLWSFGDRSSGTGASIAHQYNTSGSYEVSVFVDDAKGLAGAATVNVPVGVANYSGGDDGGGGNDSLPLASASPTASAGALTVYPSVTPSAGGAPLWVNATASVQGGTGAGETIAWNFGDGTTGTGPAVAHEYAAVGTYNVSVTASDSAGNSGSNWTDVRVEPLSLTVAVNRTAGDAPLAVTAGVTILGGTGRFGTVRWDWGDGSTSVGDLANHTYGPTFTGNATILASATDSSGASTQGSATVSGYPLLVAVVSIVLPSSAGTPADVRFVLHTTGGSGGYLATPLWTFGDGSSTRAASTTDHTYAKLGSYQVTVATNDSDGSPVEAVAWVNLTASAAPGGGGPLGGVPWSFTGVADPNRAALILIGIIAATGLVQMYRRRGRTAPKPSSQPSDTPPATGFPRPAAGGENPRR